MGGSGSWFRIAVGRRKNADPKWLLPLICRRGGLTKADIGAIRIFDNETLFEVSAGTAEAFLLSARATEGGDYVIEPHDGSGAGSADTRRPPVKGAFGKGPGARGKAAGSKSAAPMRRCAAGAPPAPASPPPKRPRGTLARPAISRRVDRAR